MRTNYSMMVRIILVIQVLFSINSNAQNVPELMYYKFDVAGTNQANSASAPVGTNPSPIVGTTLTIGSPAQFGTSLSGTGGVSTSNYVNNGWLTNLVSIDWTIGFWMNNVPSSATLYYLWGDLSTANATRFFVNGAPGSGNGRFTGTGWPTVDVTGITGGAFYLHIVRTVSPNQIKIYKNGVLAVTAAVTGTPTVGTGFRIGGYSSNTGLLGQLDEFRVYNRALDATEVAATWNITLPGSPCTAPPVAGTATATPPSGICAGSNIGLNLSGNSSGAGQTYQWQSSTLIGGPYTNVGTLQSSPALNTPATSTLYYRCEVTCTGNSQYSTPVLVTIDPAFPGGTYTINSAVATGGTNFQTFTAFRNALTCGISGAIVANVAPGSGPYNEQVEFTPIGGASLVNTITINGNGATLTFGATVSTAPGTLILNGADYINVNNLIVEGTGATYALACHLWNQADNNSFTNCTFNVPANTTSTTCVPFSISGSATSGTTAGVSGNNNVITGCTMFSGYYNTCIVGNSAGNSTGNQLINCNLRDYYFYGSYNYYQTGAVIKGNILERTTRTTVSTSVYGIYVLTSCQNMVIDGNRIRKMWDAAPTSTGTQYSIYSSIDASLGNENKYTNNLISDINFSGTIYGLYFTGADYWQAYHNTISLDQTSATGTTTTYGIYSSGTLAYDVRNNIVSISRGGTGIKHCVYYTSPAAATSNYNDLYMNSAAGTNYIGYNGTSYATLATWQAGSGKDANSVSQNPIYTNPSINDYSPQNGLVNNIGTALGVTTDITGAPRSASTPDPGAYEFSVGGLDAAISWVSPTSPSTAGTYPVTVNINNTQTQTIVSLTLSYSDGGIPVSETFSGLNIQTGTNQNLVFTTPYTLSSSVTMTANILSVNGGSDAVAGNNTINYSLCISLNGTFTINSAVATGGTNFQTFAAAFSALECGIVNPIVFNVAAGSGPYNEQVTINAIPGASATNTITINGNGRTLTQTLTGTPSNYATLNLNGTDYLIVNNLNIEALGATYGFGIHLMAGANNNTFSNCNISANTTGTGSTTACVSMSGSASSYSTTGVNGSNNLFTGCNLNGGYFGFVFYGDASSYLNNSNNSIVNCTIQNYYVYGTYNYYQGNSTISRNIFERPTRTTVSTGYGVMISTGCANILVERNRVRKMWDAVPTSTGTTYCIYNTSTAAGVGTENKFYNNLVSDINFSGTIYGMYMSGANYIKVLHNTVSLDQTAASGTTTTYGIYSTGTLAREIKNNIVSITRGGAGTKYCLYYTNPGTASSDYNDLYMNSSAGTNYIGYNGTSTYATLALWQGTGLDLNSQSVTPLYFSPVTGNYKPGEALLDNLCLPVGVTDDITGALRSPSSPDPGAYEFTLAAKDVGVFSFVGPVPDGCYSNAETIIVSIKNYGTTVIDFSVDPVTVQCDITGPVTTSVSNTISTGTLAVGGTMNVSLSPTVDGTTNGTYTLDAYTTLATDGEPANNSFPSINLIVGPVAGTVTSSLTEACVSGSPVLTVEDVYGGDIQWQSSTVSATGPWTNVGTNSPTYSPGSVSQTSYYRALTTCNSNTAPSNVLTFTVNAPALTGTTDDSRCGTGTVNLNATANVGAVVNWYDSPVNFTPLYTGNTFTTPVISNTTTYYVAASDGGSTASIGLLNRVGATTNSGYSDIGLMFDALQSFTLQSVAIYPVATTPSGNVTATIALKNSAGVILESTTVSVPTSVSPGIKTTVALNFTVPAGSQHRLVFTSASGGGITGFIREATTGYTYPYTLAGVASITSAYTSGASSAYYYYFYDWLLVTGCEGPRTAVTATVTPAPTINIIPADAAVCTGSSTTISVNSINDPDYTYSWSSNPAGFSASGTGPHTISPTVSTYYIVTATDNTAGPNAGCTSVDSVQVITGATLAAGIVAASETSLCVSGNPTLTVTGSDGGAIQWQSSTVSATGPWTNVGTNSPVYNAGTITQTTYFRVSVSCQTNSLQSNVETVVVNNPAVTSSMGATRCGVGNVTLQATGTGGSTLNWYTTATGGTPVGTGTNFTTSVSANTTYYVGASTGGGAPTMATMPAQSTTFTGNVRGYWFTAPSDFTITGVNVPLTGTTQNIAIVKFTGNVPPPTYSATTNAFTTLFVTQNNPNTGLIPCNVAITAGDVIGVLGQRGNVTSYGPSTNPTFVTINGSSVALTRMGMQFALGTNLPQSLWQEVSATSQIGRIEFEYSTGCEGTRVPVSATVTNPPSLTVTPTQTTCSNVSETLTVSSPNDPDYTYVWTPGNLSGNSVTVNPATTTTYTVTATDNTNGPNAGCANIATVLVNVNPAPLPPQVTPASALLCEDDTVKLKVASQPNIYQFGAQANQNTAIEAASDWPAPYSNWYGGNRTQILILASELTAAGYSAGSQFTSLQFPVVSIGSTFTNCQNFQVSIGATSLTSLSAFQTGLTQVISPSTFTPVVGYNNTHTFNAPFTWNGTSNLIIETTYSNVNTGAVTDLVVMYNSPTAYQSCIVYRVDAIAAAVVATTTTVSFAYNARPDLKLNGNSNLPITWSPATELFDDANLTIPYVLGSARDSVYSHPSVTRTYTATAVIGSCPSQTAVTVTVDVIPQVNITAAGPTAYCPGSTVTLNASTDPTYTNYAWTPAGPSGPGATTYTVGGSTNSTTVYTVTATGAGGCTSHQDIPVTVYDTVSPVITVIGNPNLCTGQTTSDLQGDIFGGTGPAQSYAWSTSETTQLITVTTSGTYSLVTTDVHGCITHNAQVITESIAPTAPIVTPAGPINLCSFDGGNTYNTATLTVTNYSSDLQWSTSETTTSIIVDYPDNFFAIYTDPSGCYSVSNTVTTSTYLASDAATGATSDATFNAICLGNTVTLTVDGGFLGDGADWHWYEGSCIGGTPRGTGSSITLTPTTAGLHTYYVRAEGICNTTTCASISIQVSTTPPPWGASITTYPVAGCNGTTAVMSGPVVSGASFYNWSCAQGGVLFNGSPGPIQTATPTVTVTFVSPPPAGASGYSICVFAGNGCGQSLTFCRFIRARVSQPSAISGSIIGCENTNSIYSVGAVTGADSYTWTVTGSATINGGTNTITTASNSVTVNFLAGWSTGTLSVYASLNCGFNSAARSLAISSTPAVPGLMGGPGYVCPGSSASFNVPAVNGAASYNWTTSVPGAVISPSSNSASILFPAVIPAGSTVCVTAVSSCGSASAARCKSIANGIPNIPGNISGPVSGQCAQNGVSYSVIPVAQATAYLWTATGGASVSGPNNLSAVSINFPSGFVTCTLSVVAQNACGSSAARTLIVNGAPAQPGTITGSQSVCNGAVEPYSTGGSTGATSYGWAVPVGATILNTPPYGSSILVMWGPTGGNVTVNATNDCGSSTMRTLSVAVTCREAQVSEALQSTATLYPNPTGGTTTLKFETITAGDYKVSVVDMTGQIMQTRTITAVEGVNMNEFDLSTYAKGLYMFRLEREGEAMQMLRVTVE